VISAERAAASRDRQRDDAVQGGMAMRWALAIALAGGLALAAAFPPAGIWPLAAVGPALLVIALRGRSLRGSLVTGLVFGLAFFLPLLSWVLNVAWYAWAALAVASAVIFAVLTIAQRLLLTLPGWPLAVAGWWVAAEGLRDRWPWGGFPWGRLAMSQAGSPAAGWAAVGGAPLLTFLVALTGAVLAWLLAEAAPRLAASFRYGQRPGPPGGTGPVPPAAGTRGTPAAAAFPRLPRRAAPALAVAAAAGLAASGAALPAGPPAGSPTVTVAAIQGNVPHARNLPQLLNDTVVTRNHAAATQELAAQVRAGRRPVPGLVIWPENSTDLDPFDYPAIYATVASAVRAIGRPVLVGEVLYHPVRNVGQLWLPGRGPAAMYVKRKLVPFGEYIPLRGLLSHITSLTALQPVNFTPGHRAVVFRTGKVRLGDVICYEVGFDSLVRSEVTAGANLLAVQSNDADFEMDGQRGETEQQVAMARIRAIESDRSVVYASTTGESAIITPDGKVISRSGLWRRAVLEARVPLVTGRTLADEVGPWPEYVIIALTAAALLLAASREARRAALRRPRGTTR
jgi:apolipoprotein N-acyltransferase